jgi:hypothetical protein
VKTFPEDVWTILKRSWAPQPGWLSGEDGDLSCSSERAAGVPEYGRAGGTRQADCMTALTGDVPRTLKAKGKTQRGVRHVGSARGEATGRYGPAPETPLPRTIRMRKRPAGMGNVVELRPYLRDEICATEILKSLLAACEAHAAGDDELMMARIKNLYHMYENDRQD